MRITCSSCAANFPTYMVKEGVCNNCYTAPTPTEKGRELALHDFRNGILSRSVEELTMINGAYSADFILGYRAVWGELEPF